MAFRFLQKLKDGLKKTREVLNTPVSELLRIGRVVDEALLEELEAALITSDIGPRLAMEIVEEIRVKYKAKEIKHAEDIITYLKDMLAGGLTAEIDMRLARQPQGPTMILMVGVNGTGKTTSTAKLAQFLTSQGHSVLLAAADTFRAAAGEQLDIWAERLGVEIVRHNDGADPAAVVFDACEAAVSRNIDYIIADTAGRLHNKKNLLAQLEKIYRVAGKKIPDAPHEVLLVLDATTGQNALAQAETFTEGVGVTGLILTKLDGTAKGGIVIAINRQIRLPIKFVGTGEKADDFAPFDPHAFCDALFSDIETQADAPAE